ncbi:hypothetical protein [Gemmatimonas sp.]|uniref:hypothetical protein n=1 Tax=Gemmatimonas sp. TaxID=1962908 RepID=UPI002ED9A366
MVLTQILVTAMGKTLFARLSGAPRLARRALSFPALSLAALAAPVLAAACGGGNNLLSPASIDNTVRTYSVYSMTGASGTLPAAYSFSTESLERPQVLSNGAPNFDIAFDLTADGKVSLLPVRVLVPFPPAYPSGTPPVGLQRSTVAFASMNRAPDRGYVNDSTLVASVGETVLVRLSNSGCVYGDPYYAKVVVDSIIASQRRIVVRSLVNRNCGYRNLTEGLPSN